LRPTFGRMSTWVGFYVIFRIHLGFTITGRDRKYAHAHAVRVTTTTAPGSARGWKTNNTTHSFTGYSRRRRRRRRRRRPPPQPPPSVRWLSHLGRVCAAADPRRPCVVRHVRDGYRMRIIVVAALQRPPVGEKKRPRRRLFITITLRDRVVSFSASSFVSSFFYFLTFHAASERCATFPRFNATF